MPHGYRSRLRLTHRIEPRLVEDPPWLRRVSFLVTFVVSLAFGMLLWVVFLLGIGVGR